MYQMIQGGCAPRILLIEDNQTLCRMWPMMIDDLNVTLSFASTLDDAHQLIGEDPNQYIAIFVDGRIEVDSTQPPDTLDLIHMIISQGFSGPLIAMSHDDQTQRQQIDAGCTSRCSKDDVINEIHRLVQTQTPAP